jgi:hypothetical protein
VANGKAHHSGAPETNTGDGVNLAMSAGGAFSNNADHAAAWAPMSLFKDRSGSVVPFPHFIDRGKPGVIAVTRDGVRFVNEAVSYHDFVPAMLQACEGSAEAEAFLIASTATFSKYGLGAAPGAPAPHGKFIRAGYLHKASSLRTLAARLGIDADRLEATVRNFNLGAVEGVDRQFGKGSTAYERFNGDTHHKPNPCVGPVGEAPYYAVRIIPGDLGTFMGVATNGDGQVLTEARETVPGLYAVGNDAASVFAGHYPGPGSTIGPAITFAYRAAQHLAS